LTLCPLPQKLAHTLVRVYLQNIENIKGFS
jgi:hypothetical protein